MKEIIFYNPDGLSEYKKMWEFQEEKLNETIDQKLNGDKEFGGYLIFCEHPHVYTLGKNGNENNLLIDYMKLQAADAKFFHIDRGGDITYHGPGQLVGYPIFNLNAFNIGVKQYIYNMEQAIINLLSDLGIKSDRMDGATGVWIDGNIPGKARKICAMGVKVSRGVSMHGFALNINTDLSYFKHINPCGFTDKTVTSIQKELGEVQDFKKISSELYKHFKNIFEFEIK